MDTEKVSTLSQNGAQPEFDLNAEKKLVRKLDLFIIPITMLLYLFSFLDRVNIGNARLYGMEADLGLHGSQYQTAVSILFVTYLLSEVPSNLLLKKFRPSRWIAFIATSWGIIATLTGIVQSYSGLIACRVLLGLVEGGLFPGMAVYLTIFYTKREIALRIGYLFVSAAIAGAFGGLLAFAIGFMDNLDGQRGWRWIMILEGLPTFVLGIFTWFWLADDPDSAWYLTDDEKLLMRERKRNELGQTLSAQEFHWDDAKLGFKDWKIWVFCVAQFGLDTMLYGFSTFLPTIIQQINPTYKTTIVQVLTIPCYALGALSYLVVAWLSDRQQLRGVYVFALGAVSVVGYGMLISNGNSGTHYAGCFLVAMGLYVAVGIPLAWLPSNNPRYGKRTTATGLQLTIGNASGVLAPYLYPTSQGPRFIKGHAVTLALVAFAIILLGCMSFYFKAANGERARGEDDGKYAGLAKEELDELGDRNPQFIYTI
jgi:sugar phosphate permease